MKLFVLGDIHGEIKHLEKISDRVRDADAVIIPGDLTRRGTRDEALEILNFINQYNRNVIAVHGNWDRDEVMQLLEEKGYSIHARGGMVGDIGFFGVGGSTPTPILKTPSMYSEEEIRDFLNKGYESVRDADTIVLVSHAPPLGTRDRSFIFGLRGGSRSVREFIDKNHIDLCICGHIHEAAGSEYVDNTMVVNPGAFKKGKYVTVDISDSIFIKQDRVSVK